MMIAFDSSVVPFNETLHPPADVLKSASGGFYTNKWRAQGSHFKRL